MAMETDTPGILLTEADSSQNRYRLTHRESGMLITGGRYGMTDDVFGLLQVAVDLGEVADWTQDGKTVAAIPGKVVQDVLLKARFEWIAAKEPRGLVAASKATLGIE